MAKQTILKKITVIAATTALIVSLVKDKNKNK